MANAIRKQETVSPVLKPVERAAPPTSDVISSEVALGKPVIQAHRVLQFGFVAAPIIAGADKFFHVLVNWDQYLAPVVPRVLGIQGHTFMLAAGVIEIAAGVGVALKPRIFGYVVSGWLLGIVGNLLLTGQYFDIALRDFGLAIGAFALGRLSQALRL
jgi:hypothetical protein